MNLLAAIPILGKVLDRVIPDKNARAQAEELLKQSEQSGELQLILGQLEVNRVEAAHKSIFVAGWRPACGWVCALAMGYSFVAYPIVLLWYPDAPTLETGDLMTVLFGMLGLGGLRSYEKYKGVAREK